MAFNSQTYRRNQYRKSAWKNLEAARDIKARAAKDQAYDWELPRISFFVKMARLDMKLYRLS